MCANTLHCKVLMYLYSTINNTMTTLQNIDTAKSETVFSMTGFNYDIAECINNDGTSELYFDCEKDASKFQELYSEIN